MPHIIIAKNMNNKEEFYNFEAEKRNHRVFLLRSISFYKYIEEFSELIQRISQQNFATPKFLSHKNNVLCLSVGMDSSVYTLNGIVGLCEMGDVVDAFTLVRKIRDNLYLDLFLISEALNNKPDNYECSKSLLEMNQQEMEEELLRFLNATLESEDSNKNIQNINNWLKNELTIKSKKKTKDNPFSFSNFKRCIEGKYSELKECHERFLKTTFDNLNTVLNNYVHSNGPSFISNGAIISNDMRFLNEIKLLLSLLGKIKRLFLIDIFFIDSTLFQTDDYLDAVEMGQEPEKDCQYNAIFRVIEEFQRIKIENPELYEYLRNNNRFSMKCFL